MKKINLATVWFIEVNNTSFKNLKFILSVVLTLFAFVVVQAQKVEIGKVLGQNQLTFNIIEDAGDPVAWFGSGSEQQSAAIFNSNGDILFNSTNNSILVNTNTIGASVAMNADNKSRKLTINLNNLSDGIYAYQAVTHGATNPATNGVETGIIFQKTGTNIEVLAVKQDSTANQPSKWINRPIYNTLGINQAGDGVTATYSVPAIPADRRGTNEVSLDMDTTGQTGTELTAEMSTGAEITSDSYTIDTTANTISFNIPQGFDDFSITKLTTQHDGADAANTNLFGGNLTGLAGDIVNGPNLDTESFDLDATAIYPNPVVDHFMIQLPENSSGKFTYTLHTISGQSVLQGIVNTNFEIYVNGLETGLYILNIKDENNKQFTKKLIIQ